MCTFVVCMGALSSVAYALWEEHPQEQGETLVDYEAIAIIAPALLLGTVYGEWEGAALLWCAATRHLQPWA